jgi:hypothetical protein
VHDDAAATVSNIMANQSLFAAANVIWLISEMFLLFLGLVLFVLFRSVNKNIATLMLSFVILGVAIESINTLSQFSVLQLVNGADYLNAFSAEQLNAQVMLHINSWEAGYNIAAIMAFGPWLIPAGYLIYKSGYFPKILGILAVLAGIGILTQGLFSLLVPDIAELSYPSAFLAVIGEFSVCGWLIVKGTKIPGMRMESEYNSLGI